MTNKLELRRQEWRSRLARFEKSGLDAKSFARSEGVCVQTVYRWRRKLAKAAPVSFVRIDATSVRAESPIEISVDGIVVRVRSGFDPSTFKDVIATLGER